MKVPVTRQYSTWALIFHCIISSVMVAFVWWGECKGVVVLILVYALLLFILKSFIVPWQAKGMRLINWGQYEEAIECFQQCYDYLERKPWIDKYRYITLFSLSGISYREMALCNIAFCYGQLEEGEKAIFYYQKALDQFPGCMIAQMSLKLLKSFGEQSRKQDDASGTV